MADRRPPAHQQRRQTTILRTVVLTLLCFSLSKLAFTPARAAAAGPRYFPETGHSVPDIFATYWATQGGLAAFGLPITEAYTQDGLTIQWFERCRFERHIENRDTPFEVLLGQLGRETHPADMAVAPAGLKDARYFAESGHNLSLFLPYWQTNGGLPRFGVPITEEIREVNFADGQIYTVQYFERARLEWHPERKGTPFEIQQGLIGTERYNAIKAINPTAAAAGKSVPPPVVAAAPADTIELMMWRTVNAERTAAGVPALAFDSLVAKAEQIQVADMIANNFLEHSGSDGSRPIDRMRRVGVQVQWASENISMECAKDPATAVKNIHAWMMAEPYSAGVYNHHWNIMYQGYTRIGIAFGVAKNGCWVMAQGFADGDPAPGSIQYP